MSSPFFGLFGTQFHVFKVNKDGPFFPDVKTTFCVYDRKNTNHDNDGCNDNYDGNFVDHDGKQ